MNRYKDGYDLKYIGGLTNEQFLAEANEQTAANPTAWYGLHGDARSQKLQLLYDTAADYAAKTGAAPAPESDQGAPKKSKGNS